MPGKSGKPKRPPPKRGEPLRIELPFEDALRAALEIPPEKKKTQHKRKPSG